jgi:hypothetical protein
MIAALLVVVFWPPAADFLDQHLLLENQHPVYYSLVSSRVQKRVLASVAEKGTDNLVVNNLSTFSYEQGFRITVNADGSFTYSGSNNTEDPVYLQITPNYWQLPSGNYTMSDAGEGQEPSCDGIFMYLEKCVYNIGGTTDYPLACDFRNGVQTISISPEDRTLHFLNICIAPGFSSDGVTFYPMITQENDSTSYQPCIVNITDDMNSSAVSYDVYYTTKTNFCKLTDLDFEKIYCFFHYQASGQWETVDFQDGTGLVYTRDAAGRISTEHPIYGELDGRGRIKNIFGGIADVSGESKPLDEILLFDDYLSKLNNSDYTILIAVQDDGFGAINNSLAQSLQALGIKTEISGNLYQHSYYAVLSPDREPVEEASEQELNHAGNLPDGTAYQVISRGKLTGEPLASIRIDGQEWSMNRCGINFVVYNNAQHKVVDTVCFDTSIGLYAYRPPALPEQ